jgi:phage gp29-like protein
MEGLIRSLAIPWLFRQFGYRDWDRYNEVHGIPIRAIIEPSEWDDEDKKQALCEVAMLASEWIIRLPQKPDKTGGDEPFKPYVTICAAY